MPRTTGEDFEDDFNFEEELDDDSGELVDDEDSDVPKHLKPVLDKYKERIKKEVEDELVKKLLSEDTNSDVYKGIQKVVSKKDRELQENRNALAQTIQKLREYESVIQDQSMNIDFLGGILPEMMDEDSRAVFERRLNAFKGEKQARRSQQDTNEMRAHLLQLQNASQIEQPSSSDDAKLREYKVKGDNTLKELVKGFGVDPAHPKLDYGNIDMPLVERMERLTSSITEIKKSGSEELVGSERPKTRTDSGITNKGTIGDSVLNRLDRASNSLVEGMRKGKYS